MPHAAHRATPSLGVAAAAPSSFDLRFGSCFTDPAYIDSDFTDLFVTPLAQASVARPQMELGKSFDLAFVNELDQVHPRLTMPTLCIWGDDDPFFPIEAARVMAQQLPCAATFVTIPCARVLPHEDHPDQVANAIRAFMATDARS